VTLPAQATQLALFDLDGTLIDSEAGILGAIEYALAQLGAPIPPRAELRGWIGPPLRVTFPRVLGEDGDAVERAVALYRDHYGASGWRDYRVYPGIDEVVAELARQQVRLAVVTAKTDVYAARIVASLPFGTHFERVYAVGAGSAQCEKAELIARALDELCVAPHASVMIGDRHFDMEGARANGVRAIGVGWGFGDAAELARAGAVAIAQHPHELVALCVAGEPTRVRSAS